MEYCRKHNEWFDDEFEDCQYCEEEIIKKPKKQKPTVKSKPSEEGEHDENRGRKKKKKRQKKVQDTYPGETRWETNVRGY